MSPTTVDLFLLLQILVLFRNPKDTAVSFFHFHNNVPSVPSYSSWDEFFSEFMNGKGIAIVTECSWRRNRRKYLKTTKWDQWENSCLIISLLVAIPHDKGGGWMPEWGESPKYTLLLGILLFHASVRESPGSLITVLGWNYVTTWWRKCYRSEIVMEWQFVVFAVSM